MWVNPESGKTWEEICAIVWQKLPPAVRVRYEAVMRATGQTWEDLCRQAHADFQDWFAEAEQNPDCEFAQQLDRMAFPYGHDPLLSRSEP